MLCAVATKDGISINEHFGHAKVFSIYQLDNKACQLIEKREVDNYCLGNHSDSSALPKIMNTIADCRYVFVAKIGDSPAEKLEAKGIIAISDYPYLGIEDSLKQFYENH